MSRRAQISVPHHLTELVPITLPKYSLQICHLHLAIVLCDQLLEPLQDGSILGISTPLYKWPQLLISVYFIRCYYVADIVEHFSCLLHFYFVMEK